MVSIYNPGIPTGTVKLNQDYNNIRNNFTQLNTTYGVDHLPFTNGTGQLGYHTAIHLVPVSNPTTNPPNNQPINGYTATPGYGQVFDATINDGMAIDQALYFLSGGNNLIQLTRNFLPIVDVNGNGATFLPGGFIIQWGTFTSTNTSGVTPNCTVVFPKTFTTNVYSVTCTVLDTSSSRFFVILNTLAPNQFTANIRDANGSRVSGEVMYWIAIGK